MAPKERKHLSADALFRVVRSGFDTIPDPRPRDVELPFTAALMSACAMFSLPSPSLLAFDKQRVESNLETIYGMKHAPCATQRRERLDPVVPASLRPSFKRGFGPLQRGTALEAMVCLEGHSVVALDGTGDCSSTTMHGASCLHKVPRNGSIPSYHQMLGAAMIHPDGRAVLPLRPEPIGQQEGTANNDGARKAANRFIAKRRQDPPHLTFIVTEDSLSANAPPIETLHAYGCASLLGGKEGDHASLGHQVQAAAHAGRVTYDARHDRAARGGHRVRLVNDVPLHASRADVRVHGIEYGESGQAQVQPCRWVTDLRVRPRPVYTLMRGGRARGKIDHETFKTLKHQGDNVAHTYGHGAQHLSVVFATRRRLAFLVDQTQQLGCALFQAGWAKGGSKRL